jgi:hypothetical protein
MKYPGTPGVFFFSRSATFFAAKLAAFITLPSTIRELLPTLSVQIVLIALLLQHTLITVTRHSGCI